MIEILKKYEAIVVSGEIGEGTRHEVAVLLGRAAKEIEAKDRQLEAASADAEAADAEIDSLRNKIADYERLFDASPCGVIYQLGICDQDGNVLKGVGVMFDREAEAAKMPRCGHGDRFYIVPMEQAKIVKEVQNEPEQH